MNDLYYKQRRLEFYIDSLNKFPDNKIIHNKIKKLKEDINNIIVELNLPSDFNALSKDSFKLYVSELSFNERFQMLFLK